MWSFFRRWFSPEKRRLPRTLEEAERLLPTLGAADIDLTWNRGEGSRVIYDAEYDVWAMKVDRNDPPDALLHECVHVLWRDDRLAEEQVVKDITKAIKDGME